MLSNFFNILGVLLMMIGNFLFIWHSQKTKCVTGGRWEEFFIMDPKTNARIGHRYVSGFYLGWLFLGWGIFCNLLGILLP